MKYTILLAVLTLWGCSGSGSDSNDNNTMQDQVVEDNMDSNDQNNDSGSDGSNNDSGDQSMDDGQQNSGEMTYTCGNADHPMVGSVAILDTFSHQVMGEVRVKDNCTFEVIAFTYDGGGPNVYFYGGIDRNYTAEAGGFEIGPRLNGTTFDNDTFEFTVSSPEVLDRMNSISVWCYDFNANFGDGEFM